MKLIIFAFIISISLHLLLFKNYKNTDNEEKYQEKQKNVPKSNVKFVKIKKEVKTIEKAPIKKEEIIKNIEPKIVKRKETKTNSYVKVEKPIIYKKKNNEKPIEKLQNNIIKEQIVKKEESIQEKTLENFLGQKEQINKEVLQEIERLYGREFETYTKVQKAFLEKNLSNFQILTQRVLNRLGYPRLAAKLRIGGINVVEFIFHPNGDISGLKIINSSGYSILDNYTLELIQIAYKDYPKPTEPTKLKFNVQYSLY